METKDLISMLSDLERRLMDSGNTTDAICVMQAQLLLLASQRLIEVYYEKEDSQSTLKVCKNCQDYCTARCPFFEHDFGENWFCGNFNKKEELNWR